MAEEQNVMAWVGVAASAVAVLAFFGITSFDELRDAIDPAGASAEACDQATKAAQALRDTQLAGHFDGSEIYAAYAPKIRSAAEKAENQKLKSLLLDEAAASEDMGREYARDDTFTAATSNRIAAARNQWIKICDE